MRLAYVQSLGVKVASIVFAHLCQGESGYS